MKSEHRHELKTNDLAKGLLTFQDYLKMYGGRALLVIAIIVCLVVLYFQRRNKAAEEEGRNRDDLAYAREQVDHLNYSAKVLTSPDMMGMGLPANAVKPSGMANVRKTLVEVREKTADKAVQAEALVTQGDLAWALAQFPETPAAQGDKTLQPDKDRDALRAEAKDAYQQVVNQYPDQTQRVVHAHIGLGVLAETARDWDEAKRHYETVKSLAGVSNPYKQYANDKILNLEQLRKPVLVGLIQDKPPAPTPVDPLEAFELPDRWFGPSTRKTAAPSTTTTPASTTTTAPATTTHK